MTMARVPSDPAQVIVNHASFRVQLGPASACASSVGPDDTVRMPAARRRTPVVWSGGAAPELTQAVRRASGVSEPDGSGAVTQVLPRVVDETAVLPTVVGQRAPFDGSLAGYGGPGQVNGGTGGSGAYEGPYGASYEGPYGRAFESYEPFESFEDGRGGREDGAQRGRRGESVKHAYYPHRRMNLGIVLLPLRVFLGFVSIYAGMGKLCDRVYFDGGERGSMVTWLSSLHPWAAAEPLRDAALNHPVGAGLSIAFLQVVVGVLTVCGLWQRLAAGFGAALSIALLVTVSWRTVPVYDAPDFIYLAAWSPLVIAGAPVYSIDGHLSGDAWRRLGPRVTVWDLRRRVLRRGTVLATLIIGATLLTGSVLGAAVRAGSTRYGGPDPAVTPTNHLPGAPLPEVSGGDASVSGSPEPSPSATRPHKAAGGPSATAEPSTTAPGAPGRTTGGSSTATGGVGGGGGTGGVPGGLGTGNGSGGATRPTQAAPPPPTGENPPPSQPSSKPTQGGAIGGLLGSGPLLGLPVPGAAHATTPTA